MRKIIITVIVGLIWIPMSGQWLDDNAVPTVEDTLEIETIPETVTEEFATIEDDSYQPVMVTYPQYTPWERVTLQGKLKMDGLPLSPSIKIFMLKDSLIDLSVRAPFVGEAMRIVLTPDEALAVNKMKKTYIKEGIKDFLKYYPGGISDVQNLLLGRFFLPGFDVMQVDLETLADIYDEDGQLNVVPKGEAVIPGVRYGFVIDEMFTPLVLMVIPDERPDVQISGIYKYGLQGYDLEIMYQEGQRGMDIKLELKSPEWGGESPKTLEIGDKYKRLSLSEFMRSF